MRVLITGVAGHLGSKLAQWLIRENKAEVLGIDDLSSGYIENVPSNLIFHERTLGRDPMPHLDDIDYVFHFAAYAAEGLSPFIRHHNYVNNLVATADVVNFCIKNGVKRLVFASSMAVYGEGDPPFTEAAACNPIDPYGNAKLACERDIAIAGEQHGLDWCVIRPHNVYGPGQDIWTPYRNVLGIWMARSMQNLPLIVYGDGYQKRAFSYIDDIVPCLYQAAVAPKASKQVINLGGNTEVTILEAAEAVSKLTNAPIGHMEHRHEVKNAWCTTSKSQTYLGYDETVPRLAGLKTMWEHSQFLWAKYPQRRGSHKIDMEITEGLYSYWKG